MSERQSEPSRAGGPSGMLLEVAGLETRFFTDDGEVRAVDGVDLAIARGETVGLVGESGCGKSVTALSILRLVPPPGRIVGGRALLDGVDLLRLPEKEMRDVRGGRIAMVFQEPMTSLNPVFTIGAQVAEAVRVHRRCSRREARERSIELLRRMRIPAPEVRFGEYPHRLSGGMRQRVMIAMALAADPALLIADEPTTALDVTIQAQIMELLRSLQEETGMSMLLITHNLPLVAEYAGRIAVMYASKVVESGPAREVLARPLHPYTQALIRSVPGLGAARKTRLLAISGTVADPRRFPSGCRFHPRCPSKEEVCLAEAPLLRDVGPGRRASCHFIGDGGGGPPS
jgi:peptide/nickel transport system ATP-binding protein